MNLGVPSLLGGLSENTLPVPLMVLFNEHSKCVRESKLKPSSFVLFLMLISNYDMI